MKRRIDVIDYRERGTRQPLSCHHLEPPVRYTNMETRIVSIPHKKRSLALALAIACSGAVLAGPETHDCTISMDFCPLLANHAENLGDKTGQSTFCVHDGVDSVAVVEADCVRLLPGHSRTLTCQASDDFDFCKLSATADDGHDPRAWYSTPDGNEDGAVPCGTHVTSLLIPSMLRQEYSFRYFFSFYDDKPCSTWSSLY